MRFGRHAVASGRAGQDPVAHDDLGKQDRFAGRWCLGDFLVPTVTSAPERPETDCFAEFHVDIRQAGTYCVWARLRYRWLGKASFGFVVEQNGTKGPVLPLGDSNLGGRDWHWDSQCRADGGPGVGRLKIDLKPGKLTFRITAREAPASIYQALLWQQAEPAFNPHLNLLCLTTDADYVPKDADACRALRVSPSRPTVSCQAPAVLPPLSAAEWQQLGKQPIPDWLRSARWYTKDSYRQEPAHRSAGDIAYLVRQIAACGGNVLRLSVCWGGNTYYQSHVAPHAPGLRDLDYLREAIAEGHRSGVKIIAYVSPQTIYEDHPLFQECGQWGPTGKMPATKHLFGAGRDFAGKTGCACMNHPRYRHFIQDVLKEIFTQYRPDGLYVDGVSAYYAYCFCEHCRAKYRRMFGADMPVEKLARYKSQVSCAGELESDSPLVGDPHDPDAHRLSALLAANDGGSHGPDEPHREGLQAGCRDDLPWLSQGQHHAVLRRHVDGDHGPLSGLDPRGLEVRRIGQLLQRVSHSRVLEHVSARAVYGSRSPPQGVSVAGQRHLSQLLEHAGHETPVWVFAG